MGIVARQSIKATIANYIGVVIGFFNYMWLFPYVLSPDQIGLIRLLEEGASILLVLSAWGFANTAVRYFPFFKDPERQNNGFLVLLLIIPTVGFLLMLGGFYLLENYIVALYVERSPLFLDYVHWLPALTAFLLYYLVFENYSKVNMLITAPSFFKEVIKKVFFSIAAILVLLGSFSYHQFVLSFIFAHLIIILIVLFYLYYMGLLHLRKPTVSKNRLKEMLSYGSFVMLGGLGTVLITKIDTLMLGSMKGLNDTGVYAVAVKMALLIELPKRAVSQISSPLVAQAIKDNNRKSIQELYSKSSITQFIVGLLTLIVLWVSIQDIFGLIPNGELYRGGIYVVLIIGAAKVIDMMFGINGEILINSKYYKFSLLLMVFAAAATIGLNLFFIRELGLIGAALSSLIVYFSFNLIRFLFIRIKMGYQPFNINTIKVVIIGAIAYGLGYVLPSIQLEGLHSMLVSFLNIGYKSSLITALFGFLVIYFNVSEDINRIWKLVWDRVKIR